MNYNKITEVLASNHLSVPQLALKIGMSKRGLYVGIKENSLRIDTLEKIAEALDVPVTVFFDEDQIINSKSELELRGEIEKLKSENDLNIKRVKELQESVEDKKRIINLTYSHVLTALNQYNEFITEIKPDYDKMTIQEHELIEKIEIRIIDRLRLLIKSSDYLAKMYDLDSYLNASIRNDTEKNK